MRSLIFLTLDGCPDFLDHSYIDDGYCDDETNIEQCAYDGAIAALTTWTQTTVKRASVLNS